MIVSTELTDVSNDNEQKRLKIPLAGGVEELNSGLPRTTPASGLERELKGYNFMSYSLTTRPCRVWLLHSVRKISIKVQRKRRAKRRVARLFNFVPAELRQKFVPLTALARLPGPCAYEKWLERITESREGKNEVAF